MTDRRAFMKRSAIVTSVGAMGLALASPSVIAQPKVRWRMASTFPNTLKVLYGDAESIAKRVGELTNGRVEIRTYPAGELVPGYQVLDAVKDGVVECGHTAGMYYIGKEPSLIFDSGLPYGLTARQQHAWLRYGGGDRIVNELYDRFDVVKFASMQTGELWGGWFRKKIETPNDLKGLRIRAPGFISEVYSAMGAVPQQIAHSDTFPALEKGTLDAVKLITPSDDEPLGLWKAAKHYYAPNPLEMNAACCFIVGKKAWTSISKEDQSVIRAVCDGQVQTVVSEYDSKNYPALQRLVANGVQVEYWPKEVLKAMYDGSKAVLDKFCSNDPAFKRIFDQWDKFAREQANWSSISVARPENAVIAMRQADK